MSVYENSNALPPVCIGNLLLEKMCATALASVTVNAFVTSGSAQSMPNNAGPNSSAAAMSASPSTSMDAAAQAKNPFTPVYSVRLGNNTNPGVSPLRGTRNMLLGDTTSAHAQSARNKADPDPSAATVSLGPVQGNSSALSAIELAKEITNPVTSLWSLQFQFNNYSLEGGNSNPESGKWVNNLYFQPVLPVSLTNDINLITRPVMTLYQSVPHPTATGGNKRTTAFGDMILAQVLSPAGTEPWIFGAGPTWIFPTAGSDFTGQGKWQVGPAFGGGYITDQFMVAALVQQWWSFAGDANRPRTNQMNILPLVYRYFGEGWSVGYSGNVLADWTARGDDAWTVPIGLSVGKIIKLGPLPVQIQIGGQYFADRPPGGPKWDVQFQITPVIPRLIKEVLFP